MRPYSDWVNITRDRYLEALEQLQQDDKTKNRPDIDTIAAACAVSYGMARQTYIHENEMLRHLYHLHGEVPPHAQNE